MLARKKGARGAGAVVDMHEAKTSLSRLVERARRGEDIVIARDGEPVVRLVPVERVRDRRPAGTWAGRIRIHADFDDPLPDEYSGITER